MDVEWAKDGLTGELFIVQARPETVHRTSAGTAHGERFAVSAAEAAAAPVLARGKAVGTRVGRGRARVILHPEQMGQLLDGEVLVTDITDPDWCAKPCGLSSRGRKVNVTDLRPEASPSAAGFQDGWLCPHSMRYPPLLLPVFLPLPSSHNAGNL